MLASCSIVNFLANVKYIEVYRISHLVELVFGVPDCISNVAPTQMKIPLSNALVIFFFQKDSENVLQFIIYHSYKLHCCPLPDKRYLSHGMYLYQVMMASHFLNDVANDAESTQTSKITS